MNLICVLIAVLQFIPSFSDVQEIKEELPIFNRGYRERSSLNSYNYKSYLTFEEMEERLHQLNQANPWNLRLQIGGQSYEGRNIYLVTISDGIQRSEEDESFTAVQDTSSNVSEGDNVEKMPSEQMLRSNRQKPVIFVDAGIHAREWVAPAAAFYLIDQLLKTPKLTRDLEWRIMPIVNPDGYVFSHTTNRKWRKNRAHTRNPRCRGVDLNRNFDAFWNETHRNQPCWDTFSGEGPFSEPESQAIRNAVQVVQDRIQAYITLHTYGQLFLYPYGYTQDKVPEEVHKLKEMGDGMAKVIFNRYGNEYRVLQASAIGAAAGGSDDWAYLKIKAKYSYTFELQGKVGSHLSFSFSGFELPKWKLPQAVDECWLALQFLGERIIEEQEQQTKKSEIHKKVEQSVVTVEGEQDKSDEDNDKKRLYPLGFSQVPIEVRNIQDEVKVKAASDPSQGCVRKGNMLICPHMILWGSMLQNFNRI